jgi:ABC-type branched-subunit amino acid transport system substrate-binding protein
MTDRIIERSRAISRREYLGGAGLAAVAGMAGCLGAASESGPILVGNLSPFSGSLGWIGPNSRRGVKTALEGEDGVNGAKVDGRTVKIIEEDTETKPGPAIEGFRKLDEKGVETMVGPSSAVTPSLFRPALTSRLSFVSPMTGTMQLDNIGGEFIWRTVPSDAIGARAQAKFAYEQRDARKIALAYKNSKGTYSFSKASGDFFSYLGGDVVTEVELQPGANSYKTAIQTIQDTEADVVSMTAGTPVTGQFISDYVDANADEDFDLLLGNDVLTQDFIQEMGLDVMDGMVGQSPATGPANDVFVDQYSGVNDGEPGAFSAPAYDAMNLIALAFVKEGAVNRKAVPNHLSDLGNPPGETVSTFAAGKAALEAGQEINYVGAATPQNFNENGDVLGPFAVLEANGGAWKQVQRYASADLEKS